MYSSEENILQLVSLLKAHNIKKVIASPGNTNITFVGSIQNDDFFEMYSCVDERSAAYMACGLSEESGEPVVISCTGATAARNYVSALTEAFYRKLPILAVTSSQSFGRLGHLMPQFTDRNNIQNDIATMSVQIPYPYSAEERWSNNVKLNTALLELRRSGGGPVHINIETIYRDDFSVTKLPDERVIKRHCKKDMMPAIEAEKVCIFVGSHRKFSMELQSAVDEFCGKYNAVVLCDQTSNYKGTYRILGGLIEGQTDCYSKCRDAELVVHIGEVSGSYYSFRNSRVWRVSSDGEVRDTFRLLTDVFEMDEIEFFEFYNSQRMCGNNTYFNEWKSEMEKLEAALPELPLSNVWVCQQTAHRLPENAVLHLGILNSLRSWNLFDTPLSVYSYSNVGGFGIDGCLSACAGASLADRGKLYFCVLGDLATFYDINILGNRHIGSNLRIIVFNNGTGYEMHCAGSIGSRFKAEEADRFFAAGGHNGNKSGNVLRHFADDLGFEYLKAESKEEYLNHLEYFVSPDMYDRSILLEVFVNVDDDDYAYKVTKQIFSSPSVSVKKAVKKAVKNVIGVQGVEIIKKIRRT